MYNWISVKYWSPPTYHRLSHWPIFTITIMSNDSNFHKEPYLGYERYTIGFQKIDFDFFRLFSIKTSGQRRVVRRPCPTMTKTFRLYFYCRWIWKHIYRQIWRQIEYWRISNNGLIRDFLTIFFWQLLYTKNVGDKLSLTTVSVL